MIFSSVLPYIQIAISVILITLVMLQQGEAELGGAFGGGDNFASGYHTRRGSEKVLFNTTIVVGVLFIVASVLNLVVI